MKKALCLAFAIFASGCSSTTVINSDPTGATVYLNGERVGKTPYTHTDTQLVGSVNHLQLKKEGYENFTTSFSRSEQANVGAIIGGIFVLVPFLWVMDYKPTHSYELAPLNASK